MVRDYGFAYIFTHSLICVPVGFIENPALPSLPVRGGVLVPPGPALQPLRERLENNCTSFSDGSQIGLSIVKIILG